MGNCMCQIYHSKQHVSQHADWRRNHTTASSSYLLHRLRIRAFHVLDQISGLADVLTVWHTSATTPAARALEQATVQVTSKQAGTAVEEANEHVRRASGKRSRSTESTRTSSPAITYIRVSHIYLSLYFLKNYLSWCVWLWYCNLFFIRIVNANSFSKTRHVYIRDVSHNLLLRYDIPDRPLPPQWPRHSCSSKDRNTMQVGNAVYRTYRIYIHCPQQYILIFWAMDK